MIKKIIYTLLILTIVIIGMPIGTAKAAPVTWEGQPGISIEAIYDTATNPNEVKVVVSVTDYKDLAGFSFELSYDTSKLSVNKEKSSIKSDMAYTFLTGELYKDAVSDSVTLLYIGTKGLEGTGGSIDPIYFNVLSLGDTSIKMINYEVSNDNADASTYNASEKTVVI